MHKHAFADGFRGETVGRFPLPLAEHPRLALEAHLAHLALVPLARGEEARVEVIGRGHDRAEPNVEVRADGGVTRVTVGGLSGARLFDPSSWQGRHFKHPHQHVVVHVPPSLTASVRSAAAHVRIRGLSACDLRVEIDAGALQLEDVVGRLRLSTEAGRIDGVRIGGTLDVSTSAGAVRLDVVTLDPGRHRVRTTMGAARVELARGLPVQIDTRTSLGSSRVDHPSTRGAPAVLDIEADLGAIRVHTSERAWTPERRAPHESPPASDGAPYRTADTRAAAEPSAPTHDADVDQILQRVADGSISPNDARELLRQLGWA